MQKFFHLNLICYCAQKCILKAETCRSRKTEVELITEKKHESGKKKKETDFLKILDSASLILCLRRVLCPQLFQVKAVLFPFSDPVHPQV